jgi:hypothetical protein
MDTVANKDRENTAGGNHETLMLLIVALGAGAALTLLLMPAFGHKNRENLVHSLDKGVRKGRETLQDTLQKLEVQTAELRKQVDEHLKV